MTLETSKIIIYISVRVPKVKCSKLFQMNKLKFKIHWVFIRSWLIKFNNSSQQTVSSSIGTFKFPVKKQSDGIKSN